MENRGRENGKHRKIKLNRRNAVRNKRELKDDSNSLINSIRVIWNNRVTRDGEFKIIIIIRRYISRQYKFNWKIILRKSCKKDRN